MPRTIEKSEALELLSENRRKILEREDECVMCALVRRASQSAELLAETEHGVLLLDRFGTREGHLLVIAREHVEDTPSLGWEVYAELQRLAYRATEVLTEVLAPARIFLAVLGASNALPMSFPHFHIHVLPVYDTDERARPAHIFSWSAGVLVYEDEEAEALASRLRQALAAATR